MNYPVLAMLCRGAMGIAGGLGRVETSVTPSVSFSIPARRTGSLSGREPFTQNGCCRCWFEKAA
jgi:hypothetical protein